jgi:hypothetical protein
MCIYIYNVSLYPIKIHIPHIFSPKFPELLATPPCVLSTASRDSNHSSVSWLGGSKINFPWDDLKIGIKPTKMGDLTGESTPDGNIVGA